jgi:hypothetical protein
MGNSGMLRKNAKAGVSIICLLATIGLGACDNSESSHQSAAPAPRNSQPFAIMQERAADLGAYKDWIASSLDTCLDYLAADNPDRFISDPANSNLELAEFDTSQLRNAFTLRTRVAVIGGSTPFAQHVEEIMVQPEVLDFSDTAQQLASADSAPVQFAFGDKSCASLYADGSDRAQITVPENAIYDWLEDKDRSFDASRLFICGAHEGQNFAVFRTGFRLREAGRCGPLHGMLKSFEFGGDTYSITYAASETDSASHHSTLFLLRH